MTTSLPQTGFPLCWPQWRRRTAFRHESQFGDHSMSRCISELHRELKRLGIIHYVLSSNVELCQDGWPRSGRRSPADPGVAVYFRMKDRPITFACDKWATPEENLWAITKHIEAIRGTQRWGCGELAQAFAGYMALGAPADQRPWYEVLGVREACSLQEARDAWIRGCKASHPDQGGDSRAMAALNGAWGRAQEVLKP